MPCEEYYGDDYYDFANIYDCVKDYFLNYCGYVNDDEIINCKKRIIEQWRMQSIKTSC